jgi:hypothetical protein
MCFVGIHTFVTQIALHHSLLLISYFLKLVNVSSLYPAFLSLSLSLSLSSSFYPPFHPSPISFSAFLCRLLSFFIHLFVLQFFTQFFDFSIFLILCTAPLFLIPFLYSLPLRYQKDFFNFVAITTKFVSKESQFIHISYFENKNRITHTNI